MLSLSLSNISNSSRRKITQSNQAAASFDGTNDFIDASLLGPNIDKASGTISHWAKITTSANNEVLFSCSDGGSGANKVQTVFMTATSSGQFQAVYKAGNTAFKAVYNYPAVDIVNAGWFHLAMTYVVTEENALTIKLYFNGALQNTFTGTAETIEEAVEFDRVILGRNANAENSYLAGLMDECMYFSGVLSDDQILGIYNSRGRANINRLIFLDPDIATQATCKLWLRFGDGNIGQTKDQATGIIDMSNPTLGSELVTNGDFTTSGTVTNNSWSLGFRTSDGGVTISSGVLNLVNEDNSAFDGRVQFTNGSNAALAITSGGTHILEYEVVANDASSSLHLYTGTGYVTITNTVGVHRYIYTTNGTAVYLRNGSNNSTVKIDNISLKEVQGHPAFASGALINQDDNPTA